MIKENKKQIIASIIVMLLPMIAGLCMWQYMPDQMPIHWNGAGEVDKYSSKAFAIFGLTAILLVVHLLVVIGTAMDPKSKNVKGKMLSIIYWICPVISVVVYGLMYAVGFGVDISVEVWIQVFVGIIFAVMGNWLPKCQPNYTIGIRIPWTLNSEFNWKKTHRMAGPLWVAGGFITIISGFLGQVGTIIFILVMILLVIIPIGYSYFLYKNVENK